MEVLCDTAVSIIIYKLPSYDTFALYAGLIPS